MNKTVIEVEETSLSFAQGFLRDARLDLDDIKRSIEIKYKGRHDEKN